MISSSGLLYGSAKWFSCHRGCLFNEIVRSLTPKASHFQSNRYMVSRKQPATGCGCRCNFPRPDKNGRTGRTLGLNNAGGKGVEKRSTGAFHLNGKKVPWHIGVKIGKKAEAVLNSFSFKKNELMHQTRGRLKNRKLAFPVIETCRNRSVEKLPLSLCKKTTV